MVLVVAARRVGDVVDLDDAEQREAPGAVPFAERHLQRAAGEAGASRARRRSQSRRARESPRRRLLLRSRGAARRAGAGAGGATGGVDSICVGGAGAVDGGGAGGCSSAPPAGFPSFVCARAAPAASATSAKVASSDFRGPEVRVSFIVQGLRSPGSAKCREVPVRSTLWVVVEPGNGSLPGRKPRPACMRRVDEPITKSRRSPTRCCNRGARRCR